MELIADGLLIAAAAAAALYCWILSQRVSALQDLDQGVGSAIAEMSRKIEDTKKTLDAAKATTDRAVKELAEKTARAEVAAGRLELLLASLHSGDNEVSPTAARVVRARASNTETEAEPPAADSPERDAPDDVLHTLRNIVQGMRT